MKHPVGENPVALRLRGDVVIVVGNNSRYGGGVRIAPRAQLDDGWLRHSPMTVPEISRWVARAYRGEHLAHPQIVYFRARRVEMNSPARPQLFGDWGFIQELPATIEAVPRALRVVVPV